MGRKGNGACAALAAAWIATMASPVQASDHPISGRWKTSDGKAIVEFSPCGGKLCGRILRFLVAEPAGGARDSNNPDKALRSRRLLGITVFSALAPDGKVWKGKGYSPEEGRHFNAQLTPNGNRMQVKGCVAMFCRAMTWTRLP